MIYKITIPVFLALVLVIFLVAFQMRAFLEKPLFQEEFARKHETVLRLAPRFLKAEDFSSTPSPESRKRFEEFLEEIKDPSTARLTLWNRQRVIVFSDLRSVIGARSSGQPDLAKLFAEEKSFFVRKERDDNSPLQSEVGAFLDIYIPVRLSGALVGAVEVHSVVAALLLPIEKEIRYTTTILTASGVLILAVVFYLAKNLRDERDRQASLAVHNAELSDRFRKQAEELERANKAKSEFLGIMSHELRTPLNVIMGYAGVMRDGMLGPITAQQEEGLAKVLGRAREQLVMISGILLATQMESGQMQVENRQISLSSLLDELKSAYEIPLGKNLVLQWDYPADLPFIKTDGDKLRHVLQNLINNAIKFTETGTVAVSARYFPETKKLEFRVADTGIGIPQEALSSVFDMFHQIDSSETRNHGGVGLGLYIAKKYIDALGGEISVDSREGEGTTFVVTLPVRRNFQRLSI